MVNRVLAIASVSLKNMLCMSDEGHICNTPFIQISTCQQQGYVLSHLAQHSSYHHLRSPVPLSSL